MATVNSLRLSGTPVTISTLISLIMMKLVTSPTCERFFHAGNTKGLGFNWWWGTLLTPAVVVSSHQRHQVSQSSWKRSLFLCLGFWDVVFFFFLMVACSKMLKQSTEEPSSDQTTSSNVKSNWKKHVSECFKKGLKYFFLLITRNYNSNNKRKIWGKTFNQK